MKPLVDGYIFIRFSLFSNEHNLLDESCQDFL